MLQRVLRHLLGDLPKEQRPLRPLEIAIGDLENTVVLREWASIDLLIEIAELKFVVLIENKILAKAGEGQLARYKALLEIKYKDWRRLLVFLTPEGADPDEDGYLAFSYLELAGIVDDILRIRAASLSPDVVLILTHYVEMLRRHIVPDEELRELALKVYERHKEALDFIIGAIPEQDSLAPIVKGLLDSRQDLVPDRSSNTIIRFTLAAWSRMPAFNSCPVDQWTRSGRNLILEVKLQKDRDGKFTDRVAMALVLGPSEERLRNHIFDSALQQPQIFKGLNKSRGKKWVTIFQSELLSAAAARDMERAEKIQAVAQGWNEFFEHEIPKLMNALAAISSNAPLP